MSKLKLEYHYNYFLAIWYFIPSFFVFPISVFHNCAWMKFLFEVMKSLPGSLWSLVIRLWQAGRNNGFVARQTALSYTNRSLKERVSGHRNQTTSAIRNHHISTKHPKAELKDFTIIDRESNTLHRWAKEALHICIKDPSLNRNIGKVRIPSLFNKLLKPHTQLEQPYSTIPHTQEVTFFTWCFSTQKTINTSYFLISIYNRSVIPMFTPFKCQDNWIFRFPPSKKYIGKQFSHIIKCHLPQKVFGLQVLWSSDLFIKQGWRRN